MAHPLFLHSKNPSLNEQGEKLAQGREEFFFSSFFPRYHPDCGYMKPPLHYGVY